MPVLDQYDVATFLLCHLPAVAFKYSHDLAAAEYRKKRRHTLCHDLDLVSFDGQRHTPLCPYL